MYEVTATRKRPQVFDNLVGQEFVVSTIKNAVETGRIAHAYLFSGPRGVGKTSSARILAKALNCIHGPTAIPCGECSNCREITQGNSLDVIEIDGASNTSVNDVRVIKDEVLFPPQSGRYKIYIIDEVHMLSNSAFNALLKTIEEPPEYVIFIFATTETQKVPATIRSRCQQFHFQLIDLQTIKTLLVQAAKELDVEVEDEALFWIAKEATGSMRDAYTLFDQIIAFSDGRVTLEKIQDKLGLAGFENLSDIIKSAIRQENQSAIEAVEQLLASGVSVEQTVKDFAELFRTLLFIRKGVSNEAILGLMKDSLDSEILQAYTEEQLEAALEMFLQLYRDIRFSLNPRFELELAVSRLSALAYLVSPTEMGKRLVELQNNLLAAKVSPNQEARPQQVVHQPIAQQKQEVKVIRQPIAEPVYKTVTESITIADKKELSQKKVTKDILPAIIQKLATERNPLGNIIGQVVDIAQNDQSVTITFSTRFVMDVAKQNEEKIRSLINEESGYDGKIAFAITEPKPSLVEERQKTDEIIKMVTTVFRGEVVT
ncbi:MAG: DNA polymerase III subunit gamma/tau [Sphaerochaetaceae bacterium]|jgi:DNA polymerase-3 subunit gamma/tau|nr:DNA polymerase III subunit gamma/tau [Sphaerochaetaceae bacterium]NLO59547.1 DNA polymerase III subunit gamma/tau [Spirochaetales bacterium]MDD2405670.1 DNA polymerase III subunit gamma/tau [Sphaerochaetaceae bacterium]MDD4258412.1 DNA polymerase III subunit gamma/tau [Sphaerochaetaceae bacterium]MDD4762255.1 DNA polymerase III subunit gamma/tau [Sphaerochaetaceae bacterium]